MARQNYIFGGTDNRNTGSEDYNDEHILDIKNWLESIEDKMKMFFNAFDLIRLDTEKTITENHQITWQELNAKISELEYEVKNGDDPMNKLISNLKKIKKDYEKDHNAPSPNEIVKFEEEIDWLGYYTRNGRDDNNPEIVLLVETIKKQSKPKLALTTTIIHEMFHAYYDHDLGQDENILPYVEEPLTEYAMLKFVEMLAIKDNNYSKLFDYAKEMVRQKQYSLGVAHYGFGYYLWEYEQKNGAPINWIDAFRNVKYKITDTQQEYKNYAAAFEQGIYPFWDEYRQMKLLQILLTC